MKIKEKEEKSQQCFTYIARISILGFIIKAIKMVRLSSLCYWPGANI